MFSREVFPGGVLARLHWSVATKHRETTINSFFVSTIYCQFPRHLKNSEVENIFLLFAFIKEKLIISMTVIQPFFFFLITISYELTFQTRICTSMYVNRVAFMCTHTRVYVCVFKYIDTQKVTQEDKSLAKWIQIQKDIYR